MKINNALQLLYASTPFLLTHLRLSLGDPGAAIFPFLSREGYLDQRFSRILHWEKMDNELLQENDFKNIDLVIGTDAMSFSETIQFSYLPVMLDLAEQNNWKIPFVKMKKRRDLIPGLFRKFLRVMDNCRKM